MKTIHWLAAGLIAVPGIAGADTSPTGTRLEEVIVSATRSPQHSDLNIATPITVVSSEEIQASGASTLVDVLKSQAGLQVQDRLGDGAHGAISMRGFADSATNNTLVLVDGRKLNNPTMEAADLTSIPLQDIERIEIVQGSASVLFGEQAVGGVINIITRKPEGQHLSIDTTVGSHDLTATHASLSQAFDNGLALRISGEKKQTDNYRTNNENDYGNAFGQLSYRGDWGSVFGELMAVNDDMNWASAISSDQPWDPLPHYTAEQKVAFDRRQTSTPNDFADKHTDVTRLGGTFKLGEHWSLAGEFSDRDSNVAGHTYGSDFTQGTQVQTVNPRLLGEWQTANGPLLVTAGYDHQEGHFHYDQPGTFFSYYQRTEQTLDDSYVQFVIPVAAQWTLTTGARNSEARDRNILRFMSNKESQVATEIGLSWQLDDASRLFLRNADGFRFATVDENGLTMPTQAFLDPQTSNSWELGYEWTHGRHHFKGQLYDMGLKHEIVYDPLAAGPGGFPGANVNLKDSRRSGAVLEAYLGLTDTLGIRANYTHTDAKITSGTFDGNQVPFVARDSGSLALDATLGHGWSTYADAEYTGSRYQANDDANSARRLDGFWVYNANLRWDYRSWYTNLRVNNLTGRKYDAYHSIYGIYPAATRSVELRVGYAF